MSQQAAFDTSWMNLRSEMLLDEAHQVGCPHGWLFLAQVDEEGQDLVGQLVGPLGATLVRHQAGEPAFLEGGQCLVKRGPRETKSRRGAGHRMAVLRQKKIRGSPAPSEP